MGKKKTAITGVGYSLPQEERRNTDPIFDWLRHHHSQNEDLFLGLSNRYVLAPNEDIATHMVIAAQIAMADAGIAPGEVDGITGYLSQSEYLTPNGLARVHQMLGLRADAWIRPVSDNFTNFFTGVSLATMAVDAGKAKNVIVVCGCNWSRMVDYRTAQALTAGDGAGAAVVGRSKDRSRFRLVDEGVSMQTSSYGSMFLSPRSLLPDGAPPYHQPAPVFTAPYFTLTEAGADVFKTFGTHAPMELAERILKRNGLTGRDVTLMAYQVSTVLSSIWSEKIEPSQYIDTLAEIANTTLATVPINLARSYDDIEKDWLLAFSMNTSVGVGAVLLRRSGV